VDGPGVPATTGRLSTHVLDTVKGRPAPGVRIALHEIGGSARALLKETVTNADGRTDAPLIAGEDYPPYKNGLPSYVSLRNQRVTRRLKTDFVLK